MNKTVALVLKITVAIVVVAGVLSGVYFWTSYTSSANEMADIVNRGNAYMEAECYHDAILCYEEALGREPENEALKEALVKSYILYAESLGETDDAIRAYQSAINYGPANTMPYWAVASIYENRGDENAMMNVLRTGYEYTNDSDMITKVTNIETERQRVQAEYEAEQAEIAEQKAIEEARETLLEPVYTLFASGDTDAVKELIRTPDYLTFADEVIGDTSYYYGDKDDNGNRNGKGIAIYENGYYYYGDFVNNERSGKGIWMRAVYTDSSALGSYIFDGEWAQDKPNGAGTATSNFYKDKVGASGFTKQVITGNYANGLEDGTMNLSGTAKTGKIMKYTYKAAAGVAAKSSNDDSGVKGQYIIAKSADGSNNLTSDGSQRGVEGFLSE